MIVKISKLESIGKFPSITQEKDFKYEEGKNCNIIFGFNGTGKTTLSNAISFFGDTNFITDIEKSNIFDDIKNTEESHIEITLQNASKPKYPSSHPHNYPFYVFNSNFILTHVFDGAKGKLKKFSNVGEIKNEEIELINNKIDELEKNKNKLDGENEKLEEVYQTITKARSSDFSKTLTDKGKRLTVSKDLSKETLPRETSDDLNNQLKVLTADYELSKKLPELAVDLSELNSFSFDALSIDLVKINENLSKNVQQLSKEVLEKKIKDVQALFSDEKYKESTERWFKFGKSVLEQSKGKNLTRCPICNTDISDSLDSILIDFNGYFDKTYEDFIFALKEQMDMLQNITVLVDRHEKNYGKLFSILGKYRAMLPGIELDIFDFSNIKNDLLKLKETFSSKMANIQLILSAPPSTEDNFKTLSEVLVKLQYCKASITDILGSKQLKTGDIEDEIRKVYKNIIILEFNGETDNLKKYIDNSNKSSIISSQDPTNVDGVLFYRNKLREELKKIKAESQSISDFLKIIGIDNFIIDINDEAEDENIIIKYKTSTNDKNKLRNCLSEGEKTALAFAYFLSKFKNERNTEEKIKESVVVIDDPISSLDENRLYSTAHLIRNNFKDVKQMIVLSHNFLFLKFFNAAYSGKTNCLFINGDKLSELPEELKNFESPYFYMLKSIADIANEVNKDYQNAKKYLPNYIRRVLETFLSFKFARVVSTRNPNNSPGLVELNANIDDLDLLETIKQPLKQKITEIVKITDQHSHGNAQLTEENFYISETELIALAKDTIGVMESMDKLHITSASIILKKAEAEQPKSKYAGKQFQAITN